MYCTKINILNMKLIISNALLITICLCIYACKFEKKEVMINKPDGKTIYMDRCTSCHGIDGKLGFGGAKNLSISSFSVEQIINQVTNGKGAMAPYKNILSAEEIFAVSEYAYSMRKK